MPTPNPTPTNVTVLIGHLSRPAEEITLSSGDALVRYELTVRRDGERADTVPVVAISPPATVRALEAGTEVVVTGRVRRRFFSTGGTTVSRVEVLADEVVPARRRAAAGRAVARAVAALLPGEAPPGPG